MTCFYWSCLFLIHDTINYNHRTPLATLAVLTLIKINAFLSQKSTQMTHSWHQLLPHTKRKLTVNIELFINSLKHNIPVSYWLNIYNVWSNVTEKKRYWYIARQNNFFMTSETKNVDYIFFIKWTEITSITFFVKEKNWDIVSDKITHFFTLFR